jgi:amino acid transporter
VIDLSLSTIAKLFIILDILSILYGIIGLYYVAIYNDIPGILGMILILVTLLLGLYAVAHKETQSQ